MKVAVLFSGGKDSTYALYRAIQQGRDVAVLICMKSKNMSSYMFHTPNIDLVKLQARAIGIPLIFKETAGQKEKELEDLKSAISEAKKKYGIEGIVCGAVASEYQRFRVEAICADLGLRTICPLWHLDPERYMTEFLKDGFTVIFVSVAAQGFIPEWLGRPLEYETLQELKNLHHKFGVHLSGEGGEYETMVLDGPIFKKRLVVVKGEVLWRGDSGFYIVKKAKLEKK